MNPDENLPALDDDENGDECVGEFVDDEDGA